MIFACGLALEAELAVAHALQLSVLMEPVAILEAFATSTCMLESILEAHL